ncbi:hypothetical protein OGAPHI_002519 [Ogataea philodendri]|uniref:Uncharacterized protein n=1 Tax=Ogataea philodendri TaxID=1378263 RepID=A0A9P8T7S5_9ASCO|nr:uncharacterized protein OGAPHI_002519 [Ogataea philodendri]KAH3668764.1 hypothetical protein OGAPHI_002519 [Ogataea philodendri]
MARDRSATRTELSPLHIKSLHFQNGLLDPRSVHRGVHRSILLFGVEQQPFKHIVDVDLQQTVPFVDFHFEVFTNTDGVLEVFGSSLDHDRVGITVNNSQSIAFGQLSGVHQNLSSSIGNQHSQWFGVETRVHVSQTTVHGVGRQLQSLLLNIVLSFLDGRGSWVLQQLLHLTTSINKLLEQPRQHTLGSARLWHFWQVSILQIVSVHCGETDIEFLDDGRIKRVEVHNQNVALVQSFFWLKHQSTLVEHPAHQNVQHDAVQTMANEHIRIGFLDHSTETVQQQPISCLPSFKLVTGCTLILRTVRSGAVMLVSIGLIWAGSETATSTLQWDEFCNTEKSAPLISNQHGPITFLCRTNDSNMLALVPKTYLNVSPSILAGMIAFLALGVWNGSRTFKYSVSFGMFSNSNENFFTSGLALIVSKPNLSRISGITSSWISIAVGGGPSSSSRRFSRGKKYSSLHSPLIWTIPLTNLPSTVLIFPKSSRLLSTSA